MDSFATLVGDVSNFMYGKLLIVMLLSTGIYFSIRTGLIQIRLIKETIRVIMEKPADKDSVSSFQALMVSTASRVGTGKSDSFNWIVDHSQEKVVTGSDVTVYSI